MLLPLFRKFLVVLFVYTGYFFKSARCEPLKCVECTSGCHSKGQMLFPLPTLSLNGDFVQFESYHHPGWMLARNDGASEPAGVTLTAGTPWKTSEYYIFSVFFLSETLGIDYKDFYLNKGDSCNWNPQNIMPRRILYTIIYQRKDAAVTNQWCVAAPTPLEDRKVATFSRSHFSPNNDYIHTEDLHFSARYNRAREVVQLSVAPSTEILDNFIFHIPQHGSRAKTSNVWLQSGESCYYLLDRQSKDTQGFISVYL